MRLRDKEWLIRAFATAIADTSDKGDMNFPVAKAFELGKLLLCRFDRLFSARRRFDDDQSLAAAKQPTVSENFVHEKHALGTFWRPMQFQKHVQPTIDGPR